MSARTPFIPVAKDPRATNTKEQAQNLNKSTTNDIFSPDLSNPLHTSATTAQSTPKPQSNTSEATRASQSLGQNGIGNSGNTNSTQKPLNLGGLIKKSNRNSQGQGPFQNQGGPRRPSFAGNPTVRPGTADPHFQAQQNQENHLPNLNLSGDIVAPIPRQVIRAPSPLLSTAQASGILSSLRFKTPSLPPNASTDKPNDAHTSTSTLGFSFHKTKAAPEQSRTSQLPSPPNSTKISSSRIFESLPVIDLDQEVPSFSLNTSLPNQTGPQRVLLSADGNHGGMNIDHGTHRGNQLKRPRTDHEQAEGELAASEVKRYKDLTGGYNARLPGVSSPINPSSPNNSFHSRYHRSHSRSPEFVASTPQSHHRIGTPPMSLGHEHSYQQDDQDNFINDGPGALDKLLGRDTEVYIEDNLDKYERATDRWKNCAMEDWVTGATELAARYGKLLDFVKTHMTTKMKVFATFDAKIDAHNVVLNERDRVLDGAKDRLVHESGNVLGGSKPQ